MTAKTTTTRLIHILLLGSMIAVVFGSPLLSLSQSNKISPPLITEGVKANSEKGDDVDNDAFELVALIASPITHLPPVYTYRVEDDTVDTQCAFAEAHLQRGPPLC